MKRVFALVLALVMVMSLATTAFAATVVNDTTHAYKAYQIFSGTQAAGEDNLGNIQWGSGVDGDALLAHLKDTYTAYSEATNAEGVAGVLTIQDGTGVYMNDARNFANEAVKFIKEDAGYAIAADATTVDLPSGYYLIVDVTEVDGENDAKNPALLQLTNHGNVEIAQKYDIPIPEKHILENGEKKNAGHYSIGDTVKFELHAHLPMNLDTYETYKLVFHDNLSDGLTFDATSVEVYDGTDKLTSGYTVVTTGLTDGCDFEVVFTDLKTVSGIASNDDIYVKYSATLNENAVVNDTGNPNEMYLEFSNDPNWTPTDPDEVPPTGITPKKNVVVYTTEVQLNKVDGKTNAALTGAEFTLSGESANLVKVTGEVFVSYVAAGEGETQPTKYWLLNDNTYTTTDPATSGVDTSEYASTTLTYMKKDYEFMATQAATPVAAKGFVDANGVIKFSGLGLGTYEIVESVTPKGYNSIAPITLTIELDSNGAFNYIWGGGVTASTGSATITVQNNQGSVLPETGGMGTTLFYVIGGLLVTCAAVLLVTKKRMNIAE